MNIRTRLTLLFVLLVALIMLLFTVSVYYLYDQFRQQEFVQRLQDRALTTIRLREDVGKVPEADLPNMVDEQVTIYNAQGQILYNEGNKRSPFPVSPGFLRQITRHESQYLRVGTIEAIGIRYRNARGDSYVIVASAHDRYGFSKQERLGELLLLGWLVSLLTAGIAGYLFSTDALRPVAEMIGQVKAISATNIHERLRVGRQRDELAALARTFNDLLSRLEEAFVTQKSFVSHASHELRTPLTVMMGQIEVTRLQARSTAEYELALDGLLDEVQNMIRLVNGLLELARASADATTLKFQPVRIDELLWQVQSLLQQKQTSYQIEIDFANLPEKEEDLVIVGEESLLQTAFQNLLENGCKYSSDEHVRVWIAFKPGEVNLTVHDNGRGIPAKDLPHIFQPFYRSENVMSTSGYGIGLALTKRIIDLHNGQIRVESEPEQGTTFWISLPVHRQALTSETTSEISTQSKGYIKPSLD